MEPIETEKTTKQIKTQEYNRTYYAKNKEKIIKDLCTKCKCNFCGRIVIKNNIQKHQKTKICENRRNMTYEIISPNP